MEEGNAFAVARLNALLDNLIRLFPEADTHSQVYTQLRGLQDEWENRAQGQDLHDPGKHIAAKRIAAAFEFAAQAVDVRERSRE